MFQSYINAYKNLLDFTGKTDRKAFWEFYAIHAVIAIVFFVLNKRLEAIYLAFALLPVLSISARRLRDAGFHALLTLLYFVCPWLAGFHCGSCGRRSASPPSITQSECVRGQPLSAVERCD